MPSVRAVTPRVTSISGHVQFHRDLDGVDLDRDESVSEAFGDELALPPVHRLRAGYRPSLTHQIREALAFPAGRADRAAALSGARPSSHRQGRASNPSKENDHA